MPLYKYETIPQTADERPVRFVWQQRMSEAPLTIHPVTRERVRRLVTGGRGALTPQRSGTAVAAALAAESTSAAEVAKTHGTACGPVCSCFG